MPDETEHVTETDCTLCRDLNPAQRSAMRAQLGAAAEKCNPVDHFIGQLLDADEFVGPGVVFVDPYGPLQ
jgi:hypothetical protein